jgi:hypothetical protein
MCYRSMICDLSKKGVKNTRYANVCVPKLLLQHVVDVLAVLGRVREAARAA